MNIRKNRFYKHNLKVFASNQIADIIIGNSGYKVMDKIDDNSSVGQIKDCVHYGYNSVKNMFVIADIDDKTYYRVNYGKYLTEMPIEFEKYFNAIKTRFNLTGVQNVKT